MRVPVPKNKLVAFTLVGALLTAGVAGVLALPGGGLAQAGEQPDSPDSTASEASQRVASDAPTPNQDFTPAVRTQSGYEDGEHGEYEEHGEHEEGEEHDEHEEGEEHDEHEEGEEHDEHEEDE
ncbi:hypothetical protein [Halobaculum rubrum]|uniref:hypothetical protein n=1 Tax=Halobaculum rubrum TaxID=2872158 RepID=UPI001CA41653|nr:hypothetical protein [Halobaculum rubrum]QZX99130.1 hypothetical protein K6T25_12830 [Halobaculum rubrum]